MNTTNKLENNMEQQTIKQMEQNVAELLAKAEEMKQLIEKAKKEETWPNWGNEYWHASSNGSVYAGYWEGSYEDNNRFKFGNVHRSNAEGKAYVQKRLVQVELETLAKKAWKESGKQIDWTNERQSKYHIYYDYIDESFNVCLNSTCQHLGQVFFPARGSAIDAVKTIGEERLKVLLK